MRWVKVERDEFDIKEGLSLCPFCKQDTLELKYTDRDEIIQERCSKGCYVYDFVKEKRIK